jgi:hypothetical protein
MADKPHLFLYNYITLNSTVYKSIPFGLGLGLRVGCVDVVFNFLRNSHSGGSAG